jgi:hypothetical protein
MALGHTDDTTEEQAVNAVLRAIRKPAVSPLPTLGTGPQDLEFIRAELADTDRRLQAEGHHFNRTLDQSLALDGASPNTITVAATILSVQPLEDDVLVTIRGGTLYDLKEATDQFTGAVRADLVNLVAFEETPQTYRDYLVAVVSAVAYRQLVGTDSHLELLMTREYEARAAMRKEEIRQARAVAHDTYLGHRVYGRQRGWRTPR